MVYKFREEDSRWHSRLCGWLYVAIQTGLLKSTSLAQQLDALKSTVASNRAAGDASAPLKRAVAEMARLRSASKNALHLGILMYSDSDNQLRQRCIATVADATARWHGDQNKRLRSVSETVVWEQQMLSGHIVGHLLETVEVLYSESKLNYCGLKTEFTADDLALDREHPAIAHQQDFAELFGELVLGMVAARIRRLMPLLRGWPRRQVCL